MGQEGDQNSAEGSLTHDGRFAVFASRATNLAGTDGNSKMDVFVRDRLLGTTERVSFNTMGLPPNGDSGTARVSGDGRFVVYASTATDIAAPGSGGLNQVYLHDRQTGMTRVVSGHPGAGGAVVYAATTSGNTIRPVISADGSTVAWQSAANNLIPNDSVPDTNQQDDIFVMDVGTGAIERASVTSAGAQASAPNGQGHAYFPRLSSNGALVVFSSSANNLVSGDTNAREDIFLRNRVTRETTRLNVKPGGTQANGAGAYPVISGNGNVVVFVSYASNLVPDDTDTVGDLLLLDVATGGLRKLPVRVGVEGFDGEMDLSDDGRFLTFVRDDGNTFSGRRLFVHDTVTSMTARVNVGPGGVLPNAQDYLDYCKISGDGRYMVFESAATNLVSGDTNGVRDTFVAPNPLY